jgi:hypothetical protein
VELLSENQLLKQHLQALQAQADGAQEQLELLAGVQQAAACAPPSPGAPAPPAPAQQQEGGPAGAAALAAAEEHSRLVAQLQESYHVVLEQHLETEQVALPHAACLPPAASQSTPAAPPPPPPPPRLTRPSRRPPQAKAQLRDSFSQLADRAQREQRSLSSGSQSMRRAREESNAALCAQLKAAHEALFEESLRSEEQRALHDRALEQLRGAHDALYMEHREQQRLQESIRQLSAELQAAHETTWSEYLARRQLLGGAAELQQQLRAAHEEVFEAFLGSEVHSRQLQELRAALKAAHEALYEGHLERERLRAQLGEAAAARQQEGPSAQQLQGELQALTDQHLALLRAHRAAQGALEGERAAAAELGEDVACLQGLYAAAKDERDELAAQLRRMQAAPGQQQQQQLQGYQQQAKSPAQQEAAGDAEPAPQQQQQQEWAGSAAGPSVMREGRVMVVDYAPLAAGGTPARRQLAAMSARCGVMLARDEGIGAQAGEVAQAIASLEQHLLRSPVPARVARAQEAAELESEPASPVAGAALPAQQLELLAELQDAGQFVEELAQDRQKVQAQLQQVHAAIQGLLEQVEEQEQPGEPRLSACAAARLLAAFFRAVPPHPRQDWAGAKAPPPACCRRGAAGGAGWRDEHLCAAGRGAGCAGG